MKVKTPKNSPVHVLYTAAKEIVDGTRQVFERQGQDAREIRLPILSGVPFAETLEVSGAARYSNYSTVGSTFTCTGSSLVAMFR